MHRRLLADLHIHTTASDGSLTPEQAVEEAARVGLAALGIADHDTVDGIAPAMDAGRKVGLIIVPCVEINTDYANDEAHLLGYYIDYESPALKAHFERLRAERVARAERIVERLHALGVMVSMDRIREIAGDGSIGRPHIAKAIVEAGYAQTINSAFGKYLIRGAAAYVERYKISPFEAIDIIHEAGGVAVLAHPGNCRLDKQIPKLVDAGMEGIEAYHTDHSQAQVQKYLAVAQHYGLVVTGGSDSHGPNMLKMVPIGHVTVDMAVVHRLRALSEARKSAGRKEARRGGHGDCDGEMGG